MKYLKSGGEGEHFPNVMPKVMLLLNRVPASPSGLQITQGRPKKVSAKAYFFIFQIGILIFFIEFFIFLTGILIFGWWFDCLGQGGPLKSFSQILIYSIWFQKQVTKIRKMAFQIFFKNAPPPVKWRFSGFFRSFLICPYFF